MRGVRCGGRRGRGTAPVTIRGTVGNGVGSMHVQSPPGAAARAEMMGFIAPRRTSCMGLKTKIFLLIPLAAFACVVLGLGMYLTLCKNSNIPLNC